MCLLVCLFVQCVPASSGGVWIGLSVGQTVESVCGLGADERRDEKRPTHLQSDAGHAHSIAESQL